MEPKPESLWWTSTHKHEDVRTLRLGGRDRAWDWDTVFIGTGDSKVPNAPCARAWVSWWRDEYIYRSKTEKMGLPLLTEKVAGEIWIAVTWAVFDCDVPIMLALRSILGWRTTA